MERIQALQLMSELFAETPVGVDSDGNTIAKEVNPHFLACCRMLSPDLPRASELKTWDRASDLSVQSSGKYTREARKKWADFLRELADGITSETKGATFE